MRLLEIPFDVISFSIEGLVGAFIAVTLLCSINLPIIFKFGYMKSRVATMILYFLLFFGAISISDQVSSKTWVNNVLYFMKAKSVMEVSIWIVLISLVFLGISIMISVSFYNKREFD
ncbi:hypothetical protein D3C76_994190 [compost metagenome]